MKKQTVVIIWAAALLLLVVSCFGIYYFYNARGNTRNSKIEVFSCAPADIEEYSVSTKDGAYSLERTRDGWRVEDSRISNLNLDAIDKMMNSAAKIVAIGTISRKELSGFDTTDARHLKIEVKNRDDIEIRFLGTRDDVCAFRVDGHRKIYIMYEAAFDILTPSLNKLRILEVFEGLSEKETLPEYYKYTDYDKTVVEVRTKTAGELARGKENRYIMERPYKREVDDDLFEQQILVRIPLIEIASYAKEDTNDLSWFGLDEESRATLSFKWDEKEETLYLGKNNSGLVYGMLKDQAGIFCINSSLLEFLQTDPFYLLEEKILKTDADKIQSVIVKADGQSYNITSIDRKGTTPKFYVNEKAASEDAFQAVMDALDDIKIMSDLSGVPKDTGDIVVIVNYNNAAGSQRISLAKLNDKNYAAFIDGKAEFLVSGEAVENLLQKLKEVNINPIKVD